jgi:hypothetical protein
VHTLFRSFLPSVHPTLPSPHFPPHFSYNHDEVIEIRLCFQFKQLKSIINEMIDIGYGQSRMIIAETSKINKIKNESFDGEYGPRMLHRALRDM